MDECEEKACDFEVSGQQQYSNEEETPLLTTALQPSDQR